MANITDKLLEIGIAISSQLDLKKLLQLIVSSAKELLSCDSGTIYLKEEDEGILSFYVTDREELEKIKLPLNKESIAGYCAIEGKTLNIKNAYKLDKDSPYKFQKEIDIKTGYKTKSMLVSPLITHKQEVIGVLQLINKKRNNKIVSFTKKDEKILSYFSSQAAVAIENAKLYEEIEKLLTSYIKYSAEAIDARDPATAGHSRRMAKYAVAVAKAMKCFSEEELKELEYAAYLHDIGKIGVREAILTKPTRLSEDRIEVIENRFKYIKNLVNDSQIDSDLEFIKQINEASFLPDEKLQRLTAIYNKKFIDEDNIEKNYLTQFEYENLSIRKGNLTTKERENMEAHVIHTKHILEQIPFKKNLKNVALYAAMHHEKLDGSGYPQHLKLKELPLQARILAFVDIYDALRAYDRPYKKPVPRDEALKIMEEEVKNNRLDEEVYKVFVENKIYELDEED